MASAGVGTGGLSTGEEHVAGPRGASDERPGGARRACHDLLVALAGRLPDRSLWRLRDWLAADAAVGLRTALPRTLLRHRVGVTDAERGLLRTAVTSWNGPLRLVDAVRHTDSVPEPSVTFAAPGRIAWDASDLVLRALLPSVGHVGEACRAWRSTPAGPDVRVLLLSAAGDLPSLTGAVQRALRAHGGPEPGVEVVGAGTVTTGYHRAALAASDVLWRAGARDDGRVAAPSPTSGTRGPRNGMIPSVPEPVGHG